jgi:hypothetical protein
MRVLSMPGWNWRDWLGVALAVALWLAVRRVARRGWPLERGR